jgi:hypothetical protein
MRVPCSLGRGFGILIGISAAAILLGITTPAAKATNSQTSSVTSSSTDHWVVETKKGRRSASQRYFIEFRARAAATYGHMYVLYGKVDGRDEIVSSRIAGLHPAGDAANCYNCSVFNWTIGHIVPVPSETGASDGDLEEKYVTARYRVWMDYRHFKELDAYIRKLQHDNPMWNALWNNCVEFGRSIARHMGLRMPLFAWQEPKAFVTSLREMNGMKKEQLPLRDASTRWSYSATPPLPPHRPKLESDKPQAMSGDVPAPADPQAAAATQPASDSAAAVAATKPDDASAQATEPQTAEPQAAASQPKPAEAESKPAEPESKPEPASPKKKPVVENIPAESASPVREIASTSSER